MPLFSSEADLRQFKLRFLVTLLLMTFGLIVIALQLFSLQVTHGSEYQDLSRDNFISERRKVALRGMILDRNRQILADNRPSFDLTFTPAGCKREEFDSTLERLTEYLGLSQAERDDTRERFLKAQGLERFLSFPIRRDLTWEELAMVEQNADLLSGEEVRAETQRTFPGGVLAAHLLGYVNEISPGELKRMKGYRQGDVVGQAGVERAFEEHLRGQNGRIRVVVDASNQKMPDALARRVLGPEGLCIDSAGAPPPTGLVRCRSASECPSGYDACNQSVAEPAVPGENLILSVDARLQALAETRFPGREGAVVAVEPQTGFILALVSRPTYDPNRISGRMDALFWRRLTEDVERPLTNRATQQHFPPGSTFKPFTGLAAFRTEGFTDDTSEVCTGGIRFGDKLFRCWRPAGHGRVSIHRAIVQSCDVFFYRAGIRAGLDAIAEVGKSFGFGQLSGFESCQEVPGIMPDKQWYKDNTPWGFLPGMVLSDAIGQGDVNVTPLQLAIAYSAIANGGVVYRPQVVRRIETYDGRLVQEFEPVERGHVLATPEHLEVVRQGLVGVANEPGGTAYYRRPQRVAFQVAGKTGTAQVVKQGDERGRDLPYDFRDHAWFVAWSPIDDPKIAVAVINEHGGHGSSAAAPLVMELITYYLEQLGGLGEPTAEPDAARRTP